MADESTLDPLELAAKLTIAWLGNQNNRIAAGDVPAFLRAMHLTLTELATAEPGRPDGSGPEDRDPNVPAVSVRKSLASKEHIISMIDGKPYKTLRRHLATHGLTAEEYRRRYNLKPDYPMVAETYSESRRVLAKKIGLGRMRTPGKTGKGAAASSKRRRGQGKP